MFNSRKGFKETQILQQKNKASVGNLMKCAYSKLGKMDTI